MKVKYDEEKFIQAGFEVISINDESVTLGKPDTFLRIKLPLKNEYMELVPERSATHRMIAAVLA